MKIGAAFSNFYLFYKVSDCREVTAKTKKWKIFCLFTSLKNTGKLTFFEIHNPRVKFVLNFNRVNTDFTGIYLSLYIIFRGFWIYSSIQNRRACTFINFEKKIHSARSYFGLPVYWFWEKIPPCTFIGIGMSSDQDLIN